MAGASVDVRKFGNSDAIVTLATDSKGQTILPALPDGNYQIVAWSSRNPGMSAGFDVCVGACPRPFTVVDLTVDSLDGILKPVDEATEIREFWVDVGPFFQWAKLVAGAEDQPIVRTLQEFRGVVMDPIGEPIPGVWISVVQHGKQGDEELALLRTDDKGAFAAKLPEGRYIVLVCASGFEGRAMPIEILTAGAPGAFKVALTVVSATE